MSIGRFNFVRDGAIRLPPGFRFEPTDQELVFQYLKRKVDSCPLPASIIPEIINVSKFDPWDLPGDMEQERYFFSSEEVKYKKGNRTNRASVSGYWKATGSDKQIGPPTATRNHMAVGMKKTLVFYIGKPQNGSKTNWVMHEYRLHANNNSSQIDSWVVCRIFMKKGTKNHNGHYIESACNNGTTRLAQPRLFEFMMTETTNSVPVPPSSSSSSSSGYSDITEVSSVGTEPVLSRCSLVFDFQK